MKRLTLLLLLAACGDPVAPESIVGTYSYEARFTLALGDRSGTLSVTGYDGQRISGTWAVDGYADSLASFIRDDTLYAVAFHSPDSILHRLAISGSTLACVGRVTVPAGPVFLWDVGTCTVGAM